MSVMWQKILYFQNTFPHSEKNMNESLGVMYSYML